DEQHPRYRGKYEIVGHWSDVAFRLIRRWSIEPDLMGFESREDYTTTGGMRKRIVTEQRRASDADTLEYRVQENHQEIETKVKVPRNFLPDRLGDAGLGRLARDVAGDAVFAMIAIADAGLPGLYVRSSGHEGAQTHVQDYNPSPVVRTYDRRGFLRRAESQEY